MKVNQLHFTRFLAAVSIVIYHAQSNIWPFSLPFLHNVFNKAYVGVSYFFILSGFVMVIAYGQDKSTKINKESYYLNRIARIYPVYLAALLLTIVTLIKSYNVSVKDLLLQLFVIQSWFPGSVGKLNFPGWSLSAEALFYLTFPFLFNYIYNRLSLKSISIVVIGIWLITQFIFNHLLLSPFYKGFPSNSHDLLFYFPLMHLNEFMIGNVLGFVYFRLIKAQRNFDLQIMVIFIAMLIFLSFDTIINAHDGLLAIFFAPLILLISLNNGRISQIFNNKYLILLGEISYAMYILQAPIKSFTYFLFRKIHLIINENITFYIFLLILIGVSISCYYLLEIPAKDWIKSLKSNKATKQEELKTADDAVNF